ncbi:3-deoxy-D-manno-octulosonic acid transferase [Candidatus Pelagibacter sp.]|nr:3-deoxy-D-manno-octulosonic acid transferase [Candidatus Pelagibacter sp.]
MLIFYRLLINIVFLISPIIVTLRLLKKKESFKRFKEKFCFFSKKRTKGKLLWFHGASVGEIQSIIPLLERLEKNKKIKQILVTSNTLSSSNIIEKFKFKKIVHQFFPIDTNILSKKFLNYWKPDVAFFIDSEIWPNTLYNLNERNIKTVLINGRITKKTFKRWMKLTFFAKKVFSKFDLCLSSSKESKNYLDKLGAKSTKFLGNLKFSQSENEIIEMDKGLEKFIKSRKSWCASSTHKSEEVFCANVHKELKKKYKNLLTIIIPRHVNRTSEIINELKNLDLKFHLHNPKKKINKNTDIYIVNSYGKTKSFYKICKNVFLGGSLIKHGGQNPLEATRYGCNIMHGPSVENFNEIFQFLKKRKISYKIDTKFKMIKVLNKMFMRKKNFNTAEKKLRTIGQKILNNTYNNIKIFI